MGCGSFVHLSCAQDLVPTGKPYKCPDCGVKNPDKSKGPLLMRIAELMNVVLCQNREIAQIKADLSACKNELSVTRAEISSLKNEQPARMFEFGGHNSRSANSAHKPASAVSAAGSPNALIVPSVVVSRDRSSSKRRRLDHSSREVTLGTGEVNETSVPVVKKVLKKRIFISRISPDFSAEAMYQAIKPKLKSSLSVIRLNTLHSSYSSFCLFVDEEDEKTVLSPQFWAKGTVIKSYLGRLPDERIHSRFEPTVSPVNSPNENATEEDGMC